MLKLVDEVVGFDGARVVHTVVIAYFYIFVFWQFVAGLLPVVLMFELFPEIANFVLNFPIFYLQHTIFVDFLQLFEVLLIFGDLHIFAITIDRGERLLSFIKALYIFLFEESITEAIS